MQHILHGGQHLLRLVEDILSVTSLESGNAALAVHDVAVDSAVTASVRQVAFMASAGGIEVRIETRRKPSWWCAVTRCGSNRCWSIC